MNWTICKRTSRYVYWSAPDAQGKIWYNATENDTPPDTDSGYGSLEALMALKGDTEELFGNLAQRHEDWELEARRHEAAQQDPRYRQI